MAIAEATLGHCDSFFFVSHKDRAPFGGSTWNIFFGGRPPSANPNDLTCCEQLGREGNLQPEIAHGIQWDFPSCILICQDGLVGGLEHDLVFHPLGIS